jgi:hypothetical protein
MCQYQQSAWVSCGGLGLTGQTVQGLEAFLLPGSNDGRMMRVNRMDAEGVRLLAGWVEDIR